NGSAFVAAFSADMQEVEIEVAGTVERVLPNTGDELVPYRFGDTTRIYTFVGEEAVVADIASNTSVVCTQPIDQNNAPHNFGDSGESGEDIPDLVDTIEGNIIGSWQSTDDAKFIREFKVGGIILD